MESSTLSKCYCLSLLLLTSIFFSFNLQANIALSKYRLYFDSSNKADALQVRNSGSQPLQFSAELTLMDMTEEGSLYKVESSPFSAIPLIKYSPKRGVINPGESQALRFLVRKPANLAAGEYRAVLRLGSAMIARETGSPIVGAKLYYSLPIIVRHGRLEASTELLQPQLVMVDNVPNIQFWQGLEGNRSLFGDFTITDGENNEVGVLKNVAVYQPLKRRKITIHLNQQVKGKIKINYKESAQFGGTEQATTEFQLD
jgi:fimbrial chaperone protein